MSKKSIILTGKKLTVAKIKAAARDFAAVDVDKQAFVRCKQGFDVLQEKIQKKEKIYGVTTGFGEFSQIFIEPDKAAQLQLNLIRSHSAGVGDPAREEIVRATMLCRANYLASGMSGGRPLLLTTLVEMLNKRVTPLVLEQGSVGSSGDLAPLAMMTLPMIGEGEAFYQKKECPEKKR